ncbi:fungal-specific transcription factor domain-containing protein [Xylogone sp. PMI_703]|nr:fungal-specific transcription factor domain-containing protein [Xylogone sp. PMI_703]
MVPNNAPSEEGHTLGHKKHPCVLCQQRKVKCDRNEPCGNCSRLGVECTPASALPPRRRKRRFPEAELLARLRRYEHHLKSYGVDIDAINREGPIQILTPGPNTTGPLSTLGTSGNIDKDLSLNIDDYYRAAEELLEGSSEDEMIPNPVTKTYEELGGGGDDLLFGLQGTQNLKTLHPSPVQIFQLWQAFLDNANPLTMILHAPTAQKQVLDTTADLESITKATEALMFGIYSVSVMSMDNDACLKLFNESKDVVIIRFQSAARQALRNAGLLRSSDIVVLQAFALYLISCLPLTIDPRSHFCLTGVAVRIAQRMGLHIDGGKQAFPPFEAEMRRRLWWQLLLIDNRVAELSGAGTSMLNYVWSTEFPANVNDSDLFLDMIEPPPERPGITEITFLRIRCEVCQFVRNSRGITGTLTPDEPMIQEFEQRLEREYFQYCNLSVPLHFMSSMMAKSIICKLRMGALYASNQTKDLSQTDRDKLSVLSLRMIEIQNLMIQNSSVHRYAWHICGNYPFLAHIYLLYALRRHTNDAFAQRAWQQLSECAETRITYVDKYFTGKKTDSFMKYAIANLTVKAWEARESAFQNAPHPLNVPNFVVECQQLCIREKIKRETPTTSSTNETVNGQAAEFPSFIAGSSSTGQEFSQQIFSGIFPNDLGADGWEFWNDIVGGEFPQSREPF